MIVLLIVLSLVALALIVTNMRLRASRLYLDNAACVEQKRAQIAIELLYEGSAKNNNLSLEDTLDLIDSIRMEPSVTVRKVLAEKIINIQNVSKPIGFS